MVENESEKTPKHLVDLSNQSFDKAVIAALKASGRKKDYAIFIIVVILCSVGLYFLAAFFYVIKLKNIGDSIVTLPILWFYGSMFIGFLLAATDIVELFVKNKKSSPIINQEPKIKEKEKSKKKITEIKIFKREDFTETHQKILSLLAEAVHSSEVLTPRKINERGVSWEEVTRALEELELINAVIIKQPMSLNAEVRLNEEFYKVNKVLFADLIRDID